MTGLALFDLPPHNGTATSRAAAESIDAETLRRRVYDFIASHPHGATDNEIQAALNMPGDTQRPRRWELVQSGRIVDSGETRKTSSGRSAVVWRVAKAI